MAGKIFHIGSHQIEAPALAGGLYLVATPIGNLGDITLRALQTLAACDFIYCEDTRVTAKLLDRYGIRASMKTYHEHNAAKARPEIIAALQEGKAVALVSDAGTPLISDPGFKLVKACADVGLPVTSLPGASAVLTALQLSALPSGQFAFRGFLPEKAGARRTALTELSQSSLTSVVYESPHRVLDALTAMSGILGERPIAVTRELTKLHEEVLRGTAGEILAVLSARPSVKGEIAIVIGPAPDHQPADESQIEQAIDEALAAMPASKAAAQVAKALHLPRDDVYARILKRKSDGQA